MQCTSIAKLFGGIVFETLYLRSNTKNSMKTKKSIVILTTLMFSTCSFFSCGSTKDKFPYSLTDKTPFTISYGSFQEWIAGVQGGGSGVHVVIHFKEVQEGVSFQEVYFRNQISEAKKPIQQRVEASFKGTANREIIMDSDPIKEAVNTPQAPFPFTLLKDEAVLKYIHNGTIRYSKISPLIEKKPIAYPSAPPSREDGGI